MPLAVDVLATILVAIAKIDAAPTVVYTIGQLLWPFRQTAIQVLAQARYSRLIVVFALLGGIFLAERNGIHCQAMFRVIAVAVVVTVGY